MKTRWREGVSIALVMLALSLCVTRAHAAAQTLSSGQLDQLVAPVALYPDSLLMQVLMASTYPAELVDADRWAKANPSLSDSQRQTALAKQTWDPSVMSLTAFPDVLSRMAANLDWTEALGEAFLAQQQDVLAAVQRLRARASAAGSLNDTSQLNVQTSGSSIAIYSTSPDQMYVPLYDPTTVYGTWGTSSWYWPSVMAAPYGYVAGRPLAFATGVATGAYMFGGVNWATRSVSVNNNYWNNPAYRTAAGNSVYARNVNNSVNVNATRSATVNNAQMKQTRNYQNNSVNATQAATKTNAAMKQTRNNQNTSVNATQAATKTNAQMNQARNNQNNSVNATQAATKTNAQMNQARGNSTWQYDSQHRQGANFQNPSLQQKYSPTTTSPGRGYSGGGASLPAAPGAVQQMSGGGGNTGFGHYQNGASEARASNRGAMSTGAPAANYNRGSMGASRPVYGGGGGARGGGRGGRR